MRPGRAIIALAVALSVAMLPKMGAVSAPMKSEIAAAAISHDCCEDHSDHGAPAGTMPDDCRAAAGCNSPCFTLGEAVVASILFERFVPDLTPIHFSTEVILRIGNLPFRPPRA